MAPNSGFGNGIDVPEAVSLGDMTNTIGPHPGALKVGRQYNHEFKIRRMRFQQGVDPAREDNYRLQGVQLIQNVREVLQLPVKTFDTACTFYHRFRLKHRGTEYNCNDVAMACLFLACKVEDTLKKSKEILCACHNLKNPDRQLTQDDKVSYVVSDTITCILIR
jgi:CTD kinase subunit beta